MASIEMENERLMAEMAFKDEDSVVIKIRRKLLDFLQSVKLKGGATVLLSNKAKDCHLAKYELVHTVRTHKGSDDKGKVGVSLARELMVVAGDVLKANITTLGPLVLPWSEQLMFLATMIRRKVLKQVKDKPYIRDFKKLSLKSTPKAPGHSRCGENTSNIVGAATYVKPPAASDEAQGAASCAL